MKTIIFQYGLIISLVFIYAQTLLGRTAARISVGAANHARIDTPVSVELPSDIQNRQFTLWETDGGIIRFVPSQIEPGEPARLWWILNGTTPSGSARTYELKVQGQGDSFARALENGKLANEGFRRCRQFVAGWLKHADANTGLIPRNLSKSKDIWNAQDSAADNYPFMVLTAAVTDRDMFRGRMLDMLRTETRLNSRIGAMPDTFSFSKQGFLKEQANLNSIIFGSSEYIKDGLLPLTEWLGQSPWSERMISILDDIWIHAPVDTPYGKIPAESHEVNGEMLQALSRLYWMTGRQEYLEYAIRLGDYYLLGQNHPTRDATRLRLRDHGCEIVSGLCELYATCNFAAPEKKKAYEKPVHKMLDRILDVGRNEHGMFYDWINPQTGEHHSRIADTWGYNLNGFYTVYLIDGTESYLAAVRKALGSINQHYKNYPWEGTSADGYADSIESAINLYNRQPVPSAAKWIDSETKVMWQKQQPDGVIEGWHGDGNFARTTIMYCLWKTKGLTIRPWREDIIFGTVQRGNKLCISIKAEKNWNGLLVFDKPRHRDNMKMPLDWPRINQFPEWFTANTDRVYNVRNLTANTRKDLSGSQLQKGLALAIEASTTCKLIVSAKPPAVAVKDESVLRLVIDNDRVLEYHHAPVPAPKGKSENYARSAFIHPVFSPSGHVLTEMQPPDHRHHMGIWMPWTKTEFEGRKVDFWNLGNNQGTVRFKEFISREGGQIYGGFVAAQQHIDLTAPEGEKTVLNETWDVRVYNVGGQEKGYWLWDFKSTQRCATQSPLHQLKYHYSGQGFRATREWKGSNCNYLTSEGKTRSNANGTRARWCDCYGSFGPYWAGVTIMSHPQNFRHPEPMRIWSGENDHLYFGFVPSQLGDWTMEPGKDYVFRYRFFVHDGKPSVDEIERIWNDYANPPTVKIELVQ